MIEILKRIGIPLLYLTSIDLLTWSKGEPGYIHLLMKISSIACFFTSIHLFMNFREEMKK